jgi:hypothetical protein
MRNEYERMRFMISIPSAFPFLVLLTQDMPCISLLKYYWTTFPFEFERLLISVGWYILRGGELDGWWGWMYVIIAAANTK